MTLKNIDYIYIMVLFTASLSGMHHYLLLDKKTKIVFLLILFTLTSEIIVDLLNEYNDIVALSVRHNYLNKNAIYFIDCIVEGFMITIYFIMSVSRKRNHVYIFLASVLWPLVGGSIYYLQQITIHINVSFIFIENFSLIAMSLYALYKVLLDDNITSITKYSGFWLWSLFLLLSSGTFFFWIFIKSLSNLKKEYLDTAQYIQAAINVIVYSGIGIVFWLYPKMKKSDY